MVKPNPKLEQEKLALIEEKIEKSFSRRKKNSRLMIQKISLKHYQRHYL